MRPRGAPSLRGSSPLADWHLVRRRLFPAGFPMPCLTPPRSTYRSALWSAAPRRPLRLLGNRVACGAEPLHEDSQVQMLIQVRVVFVCVCENAKAAPAARRSRAENPLRTSVSGACVPARADITQRCLAGMAKPFLHRPSFDGEALPWPPRERPQQYCNCSGSSRLFSGILMNSGQLVYTRTRVLSDPVYACTHNMITLGCISVCECHSYSFDLISRHNPFKLIFVASSRQSPRLWRLAHQIRLRLESARRRSVMASPSVASHNQPGRNECKGGTLRGAYYTPGVPWTLPPAGMASTQPLRRFTHTPRFEILPTGRKILAVRAASRARAHVLLFGGPISM